MDPLSEHLKSEYLRLELAKILTPSEIVRRNEEAVKEIETKKSES